MAEPKPGILKSIVNIKKEELPLALLMFSYFFLVITSFWILKPIKKSIFIEYYDQSGFDLFSWVMRASQAELLAKVLNMFMAFLAVIVFTWLVRRFKRQKLTLIFCVFFVVCYLAYMRVINNPGDITVWSFYLFGDVAIITGSISEEVFGYKPFFQPEQIIVTISGGDFYKTVTLYPDLNQNYETTVNLHQVLGINEGIYDVSVNYAGYSKHKFLCRK